MRKIHVEISKFRRNLLAHVLILHFYSKLQQQPFYHISLSLSITVLSILLLYKLKNIMKEFITFIREKGVLGLAVGIIMGGAVTKLVTSIVDNLLNPLIGAVTGAAGNLATLEYTLPLTQISFKYGAFISSLIDFIAVLAVVYFVFVKSPINKIDKKN